MSEPPKPPAPVRPAATVLVLRDDPLEVLMVRRHAKAHFASARVFPGGVVDPHDASPDWLAHVSGAEGMSDEERARRIAACRETFEEAGLLLAAGAARLDPDALPVTGFLDRVRAAGATLALDTLLPFGHWITPANAPKRFDTHFYLCRAPAGQVAVCDGRETVSLDWARPGEVLTEAEMGTGEIMFPTLMNLKRLAESPDAAHAIEAARARPVFTVLPLFERTPEGFRVTIPEEAGYGVTQSAPGMR